MLGHIREIVGLKKRIPIDLVSATSAMLPWHAIHAQEHERLYLQLSNAIYPNSIAARVFRLAQADLRIGTSFATRNWVKAWERERLRYTAQGIPLPALKLRYELIPRESGAFGRAVAFIKWQLEGRQRVPDLLQFDASVAPSYRPTKAVANLFENYQAPLSSLGTHREFTPLSTHGPSCSGSVLSRSNVAASRLGIIIWARAGAAVMSSPLFALDSEEGSFAAHSTACRLCGASPVDTFHLVSECNNVTIDRWRKQTERDVRKFVVSLTDTMARVRDRAGREPEDELFHRICEAANRIDFDSPEGDFILYRLAVAQPWAERLACPNMLLVRLLGRAFDLPGVYHRFERPILDELSRWSLHALWSLSRAWREACS